MNQEIKRETYLNQLIDKKGNGLIKIITGVRRCGKSYLLNTIFYRHLIENEVPEDHIIRFAFDSASDLEMIGEDLIDIKKENRKVNPNKFMEYIKSKTSGEGIYYLLLDEVQLLDCFESVLNGYLRKDNMDIFVTGSNAKFLSKDIITEFSGRGDEIHMFPLSYSEFMSVCSKDKYEGLAEYMVYGGIPLVVLKNNEQEKASTLKNLFDEIYISDIAKRHNLKNKGVLEELLNVLSSSIGSLTSAEKLAKTFDTNVSGNRIRNYLDYLEDSFLIESATRYDIKGKAYIEAPKKYYFSDLGLRNSRINFRQFEETHAMENVIYNELVHRGYSVDVGIVEISEKNKNGNYVKKQTEIDFVCNMGSKRYYIQSAFTLSNDEKIKQEMRPLRNVNDSFKKIIVTKDIVPPHYNDEGIKIVNIYDFLLNPNCIED